MIRFVVFLTLLAGGHCVAWGAVARLMPLPVKVEAAAGQLAIDGSFTALSGGCSDARVAGAVYRLTERISRQTGILMGVVKPADPGRPTLRVDCTAAAPGMSDTRFTCV